MRALLWSSLMLAALGSCGDDSSGAGDGPCTPDSPRSCTCITGATGTQICVTDGSGYGECECDSDTEGDPCPPGQTLCGVCSDTTKDVDNCGICGYVCAAGEVCSAGACAVSCQAGLTECDATCVNTDTDRQHCGGCNDACAAGEVCSAGTCALTCQAGLTDCDGVCVSTDTDIQHCGDCDQTCQAGEVCSAGACALSCQAGLIACDGVCTDTDLDPDHCGMCREPCAGNETCVSGSCEALGPCPSGDILATKTFTDPVALVGTRMTMAWDDTELWTVTGGGSNGNRLARYDGDGLLIEVYQPGIDFRSIFTKDFEGKVYARVYASNQLLRQDTMLGNFYNSHLLIGGPLDDDSAVVFDRSKAEFVAHKDGTITRWSNLSENLGTVTLVGYGSMNGEGDYPQDRGVAAVLGRYLTYSDQVLSCWDDTGTRVSTAALVGAGTSLDSYFSFSYAQSHAWVLDSGGGGGTWHGYDLGLGP